MPVQSNVVSIYVVVEAGGQQLGVSNSMNVRCHLIHEEVKCVQKFLSVSIRLKTKTLIMMVVLATNPVRSS